MELEIRELELEIQRLNKQKSSQDELRVGIIKMLENVRFNLFRNWNRLKLIPERFNNL